jgi:hypothetical protein
MRNFAAQAQSTRASLPAYDSDFARCGNDARQKVQHQHNEKGRGMDHPTRYRAACHRDLDHNRRAGACAFWLAK